MGFALSRWSDAHEWAYPSMQCSERGLTPASLTSFPWTLRT